MTPRDLRLLHYFAEIVRAGSIRGAARALDVTPPVVSEALRDLEAVLGVTVLRRTTRRLELTETGRHVYGEARAMGAAAGAALHVATPGPAVTGVVHLSTAIELSVSWLPPLLAGFRRTCPGVRVIVDGDDRPTDLGIGPVDLALRAYHHVDARQIRSRRRTALAVLPVELVCLTSIRPAHGDLAARLDRTGFISAFTEDEQTVAGTDPGGRALSVR
ncbi:MAG: LysR family transcriptional regulator, partial [Pseudomonadota bacterium]